MQMERIPNPLLKRVQLTPERTAVSFNGVQYTFKELYELSYKTAGHLSRHGVQKGRYAAVLLGNHHRHDCDFFRFATAWHHSGRD